MFSHSVGDHSCGAGQPGARLRLQRTITTSIRFRTLMFFVGARPFHDIQKEVGGALHLHLQLKKEFG
jgi:hypothetical protein